VAVTSVGLTPALAPLAARVCPWLVPTPVPDHDEPEDGVVRAMTLVLRLERDAPTRTVVLESAAAAALALCLDERAAPEGPWYDAVATWAGAGRIRKLARRARTSHWRAAQEIEGVTRGPEGGEVRALVPGPVDDVPHEVRRLQIGGTDLPPDDPGRPPSGAPVIWLSPEVEQTVGKAAAQVGHASMILATVLAAEGADPAAALSAAVRPASRDDWARWTGALDADPSGRAAWEDHGVAPVRDAGFTEVAPGTVTCVAARSHP
jgi:peptidyl-tRNA hydrolase